MEINEKYQKGSIFGLVPGSIIDGRFEVGTLIGYGGQGVVLRAKHLEWGVELALKLPLPEVVASPVNRERYLQEAETWIRMGTHPHIVRCWFVQKVAGLPGLFLDLVTGGSLEDKMKNGDFRDEKWADILLVLSQICEGLVHSHKMGVIHRDIKPENLLVQGNGRIVLTDFGLVKPMDTFEESANTFDAALESMGPQNTGVTGFGQFVGTPRYGAPEQWNKAMILSAGTDLYALGVLFFEMLCGRRPFDEGERLDPLELIQRHLHQAPPDPREFNDRIPETLAKLALRCLEKNPVDRPSSAEEMIALCNRELTALKSKTFQRPSETPDGERGDLLNNAGVSLYSLGKPEQARELFEKGLFLEAGHPECLYNLVQLDRREGEVHAGESLRRLHRAQALYQLILLCIEEGLGQKALELLKAIPKDQKNGLLHRIEGDALMYSRDFNSAYDAYGQAKLALPLDRPTKLRMSLALDGRTHHEGRILFPSSVSCLRYRPSAPESKIVLSHDSQYLLEITKAQLILFSLVEANQGQQIPRRPGSQNVLKVWLHQRTLILQEASHFEIWDLGSRKLYQHNSGQILAMTRSLDRQVVQNTDGLFLVDQTQKRVQRISVPDNGASSPFVKACFTTDEQGICILTSTGQIASVDSEYRAVPLPWPPKVPGFENVSCFEIDKTGRLYLTSSEGKFQAVDFARKKLVFSLKLSFVPESLAIDASHEHVVLSSPKEFGIVNFDGKVVFRGKGPCVLAPSGSRILAWSEGFLTLYSLSPFRRLRTWAERMNPPSYLYLGEDEKRALSQDPEGKLQVWEVDEESRVYERNLLLTAGVSYEEVMSSYRAFRSEHDEAVRLYSKGKYAPAYGALSQSRRVSSFQQHPKALSLQWELCKYLKRESLEAVWERFASKEANASTLSQDHKTLLLAGNDFWSLRDFGSFGGSTRLSGRVSSPVLDCRYLSSESSHSVIILAHRDGTVSCLNAENGAKLSQDAMGLGPIGKAVSLDNSIFLLAEDNTLGFFDLSTLSVRSQMQIGQLQSDKAFPLSGDRVLFCVPGDGVCIADLKRGLLRTNLFKTFHEQRGDVTFASSTGTSGLILLGFSNGSLLALHEKNEKILFSFELGKGPISGILLNAAMALGVSVDEGGNLALFDLRTAEVLESFRAHSDGIVSAQLTPDTRFLSTMTKSGESRFWELSWFLTKEKGNISVPWLSTGALGKLGNMFRRS